ncbi:hypothetical protein AB0M86_20310 [Streptomyces sp. NPDC051639]|uniref:hypothetical protein n=1 Tax=unclassified Streptomyces TaxID=2593676 RepID=UPI003447AEA8
MDAQRERRAQGDAIDAVAEALPAVPTSSPPALNAATATSVARGNSVRAASGTATAEVVAALRYRTAIAAALSLHSLFSPPEHRGRGYG